MEHDFGVVRPGQVCSHTFLFVNPTETPLRSARIKRSCACTVASVTPAVIEPGAEARIEVAYEAPKIAVTDSKSMSIQFQDVSSLRLALRVKATIRPELYLPQEKIGYMGMPKSARQTQPIRVENFGTQVWSSVSVQGLPDWLTWRAERVAAKPSSNADTKTQPFEEWSIFFTADESLLSGDEAEAKLVVKAATADANSEEGNPQAELTVHAASERKLQTFPSRLHVRPVAGGVVRKQVVLKLAPQCQDAGAGEFQLTHDLGDRIAIGEVTGSGQVRRLSLSFPKQSDMSSGSISISLKRNGSAEPVARAVIPVVFSQ